MNLRTAAYAECKLAFSLGILVHQCTFYYGEAEWAAWTDGWRDAQEYQIDTIFGE